MGRIAGMWSRGIYLLMDHEKVRRGTPRRCVGCRLHQGSEFNCATGAREGDVGRKVKEWKAAGVGSQTLAH